MNKEQTKSEEKFETLLLVYLGVQINAKDELYHEYQRVAENKRVGDTMWYKKKLYAGMPGGIFTIETKDGGQTVRSGTVKHVGLWGDEDERIQWSVDSRAKENAREEAHAVKKIMTRNVALERLEPFRAAYRRSHSASVRRQVLAEIIRYVTT
jgi:hypothetical protein